MFRSYYSVFKVRLGDVPQSPVSRNFEKHHMVGQNGLEPSTSRLSVVRSSQLSYGPIGGDKRVRTVDPLLAKQVLSQLSYTPVYLGQDPEN